jgi:hypothetical protein
LTEIDVRKPVDLAAALAAIGDVSAQELNLEELVRGYADAALGGSDTRLKKRVSAFGRSPRGLSLPSSFKLRPTHCSTMATGLQP